MLDLGSEIERQLRKLIVHCPHDIQGMFRSVQEIRVPERNVCRAFTHLPSDVFQDYIPCQNKEPSFVHWWDRAVRAQVQTATTCFDVARRAEGAVVLQLGVFVQCWQCATRWNRERKSFQIRFRRPSEADHARNITAGF